MTPFRSLIAAFLGRIRRFRPAASKGQTLVEYALILCLISIVAAGVFSQLGQRVLVVFSAIDTLLDTAQSSH